MVKRKVVKKESNHIQNVFVEFLEKFAEVIVSLIEKVKVGEWINDLLHIKSRIKKYALLLVLSVVALIVFLLGFASFLASKIPFLGNGVGEMLIALILMVIIGIYYKIR